MEINIAEDLQIEKKHKFFHKADTTDQIVKITSIKKITRDQTQTELNTRTKIEIVPFQTLEIDVIQTIDPELHHIIETGITQIIELDNVQTIDHETIQTTDQTISTNKIDHKVILQIETIITQVDKEIFLSHHTEIKHNIIIHNKILEAVHLNTKDRYIRYNQMKKLNQTLRVLKIQKFQNYS